MPFRAANGLLAVEKADLDRLEKDVSDAAARGARTNSREVLNTGDALKRKKLTIAALQKRLNELRRKHDGKPYISLERTL